ncbi:hypothetical protein C8F04DRAFT_1252216 [Mycena alexandri]|uniref:Uncharacterized protein n=1 Tax=Mycena alexandri TaxID=1745969 RepID=A0AAD6T9Y8_9AGAR|nr:hypothetical protein C8F04DRAFT_1252216 [Mycena alexandri]
MLLLEHLRQAGHLSLTAVEYGTHFAAVRQGTCIGGSEYLFIENSSLSPYPEYRGTLSVRISILVGEIAFVSESLPCSLDSDFQVLCIKIKAPANCASEGLKVYEDQLQRLEKIIRGDAHGAETVGDSWFDMRTHFVNCGPEPGCFYVLLRDNGGERIDRVRGFAPGTTVAFCCTMRRTDRDIDTSRNYYMYGIDFQEGDFPEKCGE